jgi:hypothetical protein
VDKSKNEARRARRDKAELRRARRALEDMGLVPRMYDHYVVVLTGDEAIMVANVLARLGLALSGLTLVVDEDDPLFTITPRDIHAAHSAISDALQNRWLGSNEPD